MKKKITGEKKFHFFRIKTTIYLSLGLHEGRPSYRRSPQPSKENIQHFKTWTFLFFQFLWVIFIFALLDPDQDQDSESGYGSTDLIESGSNPDPKRWFSEILLVPTLCTAHLRPRLPANGLWTVLIAGLEERALGRHAQRNRTHDGGVLKKPGWLRGSHCWGYAFVTMLIQV
jgi:hypothetical protein